MFDYHNTRLRSVPIGLYFSFVLGDIINDNISLMIRSMLISFDNIITTTTNQRKRNNKGTWLSKKSNIRYCCC